MLAYWLAELTVLVVILLEEELLPNHTQAQVLTACHLLQFLFGTLRVNDNAKTVKVLAYWLAEPTVLVVILREEELLPNHTQAQVLTACHLLQFLFGTLRVNDNAKTVKVLAYWLAEPTVLVIILREEELLPNHTQAQVLTACHLLQFLFGTLRVNDNAKTVKVLAYWLAEPTVLVVILREEELLANHTQAQVLTACHLLQFLFGTLRVNDNAKTVKVLANWLAEPTVLVIILREEELLPNIHRVRYSLHVICCNYCLAL